MLNPRKIASQLSSHGVKVKKVNWGSHDMDGSIDLEDGSRIHVDDTLCLVRGESSHDNVSVSQIAEIMKEVT